MLSQEVLDAVGNMDSCASAQSVFEFCDFVRDAEGSICLHKELFSYSFFACISVVCGWYLTKRWILSERSRVGAWGKFDAKTQQQIVRIGTKMAPKSTN